MEGLHVVDYGLNNVGSVVSMLRRLDAEPVVTRRGEDLADATAIVLPGIGAFDAAVDKLERAGLFDALKERAARGAPLLGICLGMQLLARSSDEGTRAGLGVLPAAVHRLPVTSGLKLPNMGWHDTEGLDRELFDGLEAPRFYYAHSFHVVCDDVADVAARCTYGAPFVAAVRRGNVFGTQFHPEKSHRFGMRVLQNFLRLAAPCSARA